MASHSQIFLILMIMSSSSSPFCFGGSRKELRDKDESYTQSNYVVGSKSVDPRRVLQLSWLPRVFLYRGFLSEEECDHLISLRKETSEVKSGDADGKTQLVSSEQALDVPDPIVAGIEEKISAWTFLPREDSSSVWHESLLATIILYVTNTTQGGEILFPNSEVKTKNSWSDCSESGNILRPVKGNAVLFFTRHLNASLDPRSTHFRCPVLKGELLAATKLIYAKKQARNDEDSGECSDEDENCGQWAELGECKKNPIQICQALKSRYFFLRRQIFKCSYIPPSFLCVAFGEWYICILFDSELLERKKRKKLRQKEQRVKDQTKDAKEDESTTSEEQQQSPAESSRPLSVASDTEAQRSDSIPTEDSSSLEEPQVLEIDNERNGDTQAAIVDGDGFGNGPNMERRSGRREMERSQYGMPNGFHGNHAPKLGGMRKNGTNRDARANTTKVWSRKADNPKSISPDAVVAEPEQTKNSEVLIGSKPGSKVLYLGAASGTTVSHVSDIVGPEGCVYAVEFSHRSGRDLVNMAKKRTNIIPIIEDARHPAKYRMLVGMVDVVFADVAQPDQARIVALNSSFFLKTGGHFNISIKANCIDSTVPAEAVFQSEVKKLQQEQFKPAEQVTLEPFERDHACVVGTYRAPKKTQVAA
ncbi:unnamed protein product [Brassica rapa subsp. narinosa]